MQQGKSGQAISGVRSTMEQDSEKFYNRFSVFYPVVDAFLRPQKEKFFAEINSHPHGRLLEIGVGNGSHFKYYDRHDIVGVDTSNKMLDQARKHLKSNIEVCHMNGEELLFSNGLFDYVVLCHVIAVVNDPEKLLTEVHRTLKPGGKLFILNHFTPDNALRYVDKALSVFSKRFHFRSDFRINTLKTLQHFALVKGVDVSPLSYFKMFVYQKRG